MKRKNSKLIYLIIVIVTGILGLLNQNIDNQKANKTNNYSYQNESKTIHSIGTVEDKKLASIDFKNGNNAYIYVNNNKSILKAKQWKKNKIDYGNLDELNRTTTATGYLEKRNLVKSSTRTAQTWRPTGWHQKAVNINGHRKEILNRGHLLAYSVTGGFNEDGVYDKDSLGSLDNPKNLATQTEFSNQRTMQIFEEKVRNALAQNKKVIYRVTTVFKGTDLMPKGYHLQAVSTDGELNFNVFVWNVEPGIKFDYSTGRSIVDKTMKVKELGS